MRSGIGSAQLKPTKKQPPSLLAAKGLLQFIFCDVYGQAGQSVLKNCVFITTRSARSTLVEQLTSA